MLGVLQILPTRANDNHTIGKTTTTTTTARYQQLIHKDVLAALAVISIQSKAINSPSSTSLNITSLKNRISSVDRALPISTKMDLFPLMIQVSDPTPPHPPRPRHHILTSTDRRERGG
jgi:hypothetical protein